MLAVGCHTEPTPDKPTPAPTDGVVFTANNFAKRVNSEKLTSKAVAKGATLSVR